MRTFPKEGNGSCNGSYPMTRPQLYGSQSLERYLQGPLNWSKRK